MSITIMTHEQSLKENGYDLCVVVSGSMKPMLRVHKDSILFVKPEKALRRGDVVMYRGRSGVMIMHRIVRALPEDFLIRGDNCLWTERVAETQIYAVMKGFYRGEKYIPAENMLYRLYVTVWLAFHPLFRVWKRWRKWRRGRWRS